MFGRRGVEPLRPVDHPAVRQVDALRAFADGRGAPHGAELEFLGELAAMQIDQRLWPLPADADDPWTFLPSTRLRDEMRRRLRDSGSFGDTLAELYVWAYLRDAGFDVALTETEGTADLKIERDGAVVYGDVKRRRLGSSAGGAGSAVTKANRQIKRSAGEDHAGVVFVHIDRPVERVALDDRVPADVEVVLQELRAELSGQHNRSVAAAVVYWDDIVIVEDASQETVGYFFRRRATLVEHERAREPLQIRPNELEPTAWFATGVKWPRLSDDTLAMMPGPEPRARGSIVATPVFQQMNVTAEGVRTGHAIDLFANPDAVSGLPGGVVVAVRHLSGNGCTLLGVATERNEQINISFVFRLYGDNPVLDPESALLELLERFGLPTR
jgi:hypothetical protein